MNNINDIIICIPIYNEKKNIRNVVSNANKYGNIVIIDDNSTDDFQTELKDYKLKIIRNSINLGYEKSIIKGLDYALEQNAKLFCIIDGDFEINPKYIGEFKKEIIDNHIVIGNRDIKKRFIERIFASVYRIFFNVNDPLCGIKLLNLEKYDGSYHKKLNYDSYSTFLANFFIKKKSNIKNFNISIKIRGETRLGNNLYVSLKLLSLLFRNLFEIIIKKN